MTEPGKDFGGDKTCGRDKLASFGTVFVVRMLSVKIAELSSSTLSVFLLPSSAFHFCLIVFLREEVLERGMVIIPDTIIQRWFGQTSGWSFQAF